MACEDEASRSGLNRCSVRSAWRIAGTTGPRTFPADFGGGWIWRGDCCTVRSCCCSTNPPVDWTRWRARAMWDDLRRLRGERGVTVLLTTHFIEEAERCDRVGILDRGRLVAEGAPEALKRSMNKDVLVIEAEDTEALRAEIEAHVSVSTVLVDGTLRIECEDGQAMMASLYAGFRERISAIRLGRPTLEDVFIRETGRPFATGEDGNAG